MPSKSPAVIRDDIRFMRRALALARRASGNTSPNPLVGAVLVKRGRILGEGWHHQAGLPHAEIEALADARKRKFDPAGATLYVTLEPCSTFGRTPPCIDALRLARLRRVVVGSIDPNPVHAGRALKLLHRAGIATVAGVLEADCQKLNSPFNFWIAHRLPYVVLKVAMTLDGKIATASGESKWITGEESRAVAMQLRHRADAVLVGVNTVIADDPSLTFRLLRPRSRQPTVARRRLRVILDSRCRTPLDSKVVRDAWADRTIIVTTRRASMRKRKALASRVTVWTAPLRAGHVDLRWTLRRLGRLEVTSLLVEGGGEVTGSFLDQRLAHEVAFFYAPRILGGNDARKAIAGIGAVNRRQIQNLRDIHWRRLGGDLLLTAQINPG